MIRLARDLLWLCLVLAIAVYGAVVVRNVTAAMVGMASHQPALAVAEIPTR